MQGDGRNRAFDDLVDDFDAAAEAPRRKPTRERARLLRTAVESRLVHAYRPITATMQIARQPDANRPAAQRSVGAEIMNPMKTSFLFGLALALVLAGCSKSTRSSNADTSDGSAMSTTANSTSLAKSATSAIRNAASDIAIAARMTEWKLNPSDIQPDLDSGRDIVRTKSSPAGAPTGTTDKEAVESMVKGRLAADSAIAALNLKINADRNGEVKLSGKARSAEEVGRAIALALDTEGVTKVSADIHVGAQMK